MGLLLIMIIYYFQTFFTFAVGYYKTLFTTYCKKYFLIFTNTFLLGLFCMGQLVIKIWIIICYYKNKNYSHYNKKKRPQDSVKTIYQCVSFDNLWGDVHYGNNQTILTVRQADYKLPKLGSTHNYNLTRYHNQLATPKINLNFDRKTPLVGGIWFYNSLPENINEILFVS